MAEWFQAFRTRLSLVLVCKLWNNLASEYLYRSILFTQSSCPKLVQLVLQLVNNGMVKHVQRISLHSSYDADLPESSLRSAISQFPNLRVLEIRNYGLRTYSNVFGPEVNQIHITTLYASFTQWSAFETLAFLPHLQHLRCAFRWCRDIGPKVSLAQLKTLHIESHGQFHKWLDLPILHYSNPP